MKIIFLHSLDIYKHETVKKYWKFSGHSASLLNNDKKVSFLIYEKDGIIFEIQSLEEADDISDG